MAVQEKQPICAQAREGPAAARKEQGDGNRALATQLTVFISKKVMLTPYFVFVKGYSHKMQIYFLFLTARPTLALPPTTNHRAKGADYRFLRQHQQNFPPPFPPGKEPLVGPPRKW